MNAKNLNILLLVTVVVVFAAFAVQRLSGTRGGGEDLPDRVLPGLTDRVNDVASIEVASAGESLRLESRDGRWVVASLDGYPAQFETVKQAIVSLAELEPRERKTSEPARYGRIGLEDPGESGESVGAVLRDDAGAEIASVVLGDSVSEGGTEQRYVRVAGNPQAWLAEGRVNLPTDTMQWVDREIVRIPRDRVTRVTITHADGEVVSIVREQGGSGYALETIPEGRTAKTPGEIGGPASALSFLRFDDVRSAGTDEERPEPVVTDYVTAEGLELSVATWKVGDKIWAAFVARAVPQEPDAAPAEGADAEAPAETADADPAQTAPEAAEEADPLEAARTEAAGINERLSGWVFALPEYQASSIRKRLDDLTQAPEPSAGEGPAGEFAEPDDGPVSAPMLDARDGPGGGG